MEKRSISGRIWAFIKALEPNWADGQWIENTDDLPDYTPKESFYTPVSIPDLRVGDVIEYKPRGGGESVGGVIVQFDVSGPIEGRPYACIRLASNLTEWIGLYQIISHENVYS